MTVRIERLTEAQKARFPEYVERWTKIGLCTEPAERERAKRAICSMYTNAGLSEPKVVFCGSPLGNALARAALSNPDSVRNSVGASVVASVWASVRASVWASTYGQHDAGWLSFYAYFREVCGLVEQTEPLVGLFELAKSAGWALPCERICWVSERHDVVRLDAQGRLHCDNGPALHYPDGWAIHALNGVRVPEWLVETKAARLDARQFAELDNAEVRREFVRKVGIERIVTELGAEVLDRRGDYELLSVDLGGRTGKWPYLKMRNPSIGVWHLEAVVKECATVEQALNWRNGGGAFEHIAPMT